MFVPRAVAQASRVAGKGVNGSKKTAPQSSLPPRPIQLESSASTRKPNESFGSACLDVSVDNTQFRCESSSSKRMSIAKSPEKGSIGSSETHHTCVVPETNGLHINGADNINSHHFHTHEISSPSKHEGEAEKSKSSINEAEEDNHDDGDEDGGEDDEPVVQYAKDQRAPLPGEPVCIVCARYGAYICDKTEADVCSIECKAINLSKQELSICDVKDADPDKKEDTQRLSAFEVEQIMRQNAALESNAFDQAVNWCYTEDPEVSSITSHALEALLDDLSITIKAGPHTSVPRPILDFRHCRFPPKLCVNLEQAGYIYPTPVQMQAIPVALSEQDVICNAETGSGKTLSFLLPAILHSAKFFRQNELAHPRCLIIAPTRELGIQIEDKMKPLAQGFPVRTALLVGGLPTARQIFRIKRGVQVIIGTPGRILDIIKMGELPTAHISLLVLDEVDMMFKLGFGEQVKEILEFIGPRQTLLYSATIPPAIQELAQSICKSPVAISLGTKNKANENINQMIVWVEENAKKKMLLQILNQKKYYKPPILIFVNSKVGAELLSDWISKQYDIKVGFLHGDRKQAERTSTLKAFVGKEFEILVSTGVLGRGLDLIHVSEVINFDMPPTIYEYIHQIGRAGRLGSSGMAITLINSESKRLFPALASLVKDTKTILPREVIQYAEYHGQDIQTRKRPSHTGSISAEPSTTENWKDELFRRKITRK